MFVQVMFFEYFSLRPSTKLCRMAVALDPNELVHHIQDLPPEIKWRILSFTPPTLLTKLELSNKDAWMIFNAGRKTSVTFDDRISWIDKLNSVSLTISDSMYIMTLADLYTRTDCSMNESSLCLSVLDTTTFDLVPLVQEEGFVLKNRKCSEIPWPELSCISDEVDFTTTVLSKDSIPRSSSVYKFLERELCSDEHVRKFFEVAEHLQQF